MSVPPAGCLQAVLDTSFWMAAYRAEVAANCFDLFDIVVPRAVEAEIRRRQEGYPSREYPHTTLFRQLHGRMVDPPMPGPPPLPLFGRGEAEAIPLAAHLRARLLINEYRAAQYARNLGVQVVTVPDVVVTLRAEGVISDRAVRRKLDILAPITADEWIADALRALDAL